MSILLGVVVLLIPYYEGYYAAKYGGVNFFVSILLGVITLCIADLKSYLTRKVNETTLFQRRSNEQNS